MTVSYARSTYSDIIDEVIFDLNEPKEKITRIVRNEWKRWLLDACKDLCDQAVIYDQKQLRLIKGQEDYPLVDTRNAQGTGTVTATGTDVVGIGTKFLTELVAGSLITASGESHKITAVTDDTHITIDSAFIVMVAGVIFTFSPRASEIPNDVKTVYFIDRLEGGWRKQVLMKDMRYLLSLRRDDGTPVYSNCDIPYVAAEHTLGGVRYLRFYPSAEVDKTVTLYTVLQVNPRLHWTDDNDSAIPIGEYYEHAIKHYMAMKFYSYWHEIDNEKKYISLYRAALQSIGRNEPNLVTLDLQYR